VFGAAGGLELGQQQAGPHRAIAHMDLQYSVKDAMSIEETEALIRGQSSPTDSRLTPVLRPRLKKYRTRFYILFSFALIGMCQCMNCFTLTSLPDSTEEYFGITQAELIFIFNWQPLANTVGALFASALYSTLGTKWTVRLLALLASAGPALRCVPSLVPAVKASRDLTLLCLHASSIINGCGGPILNSAPALISAIWFPAKERMTATGILGTCPVLGSMVGFFIGPRIVHHASGGWDSSKRHRRMIAVHSVRGR
jgi:FLVCR family MFS transporter